MVKEITGTSVKDFLESANNKAAYTFYDEEGNQIGGGFLDPKTMSSEAMQALSGKTVSRNTYGAWDIDGSESAKPLTSMTLDSNTGKVKISAPQYMLDNSEWLKSNFTNNDNFKSLVGALKLDPQGKTSVKYTDENGEEKETTLLDMFNKYQEAFDEYAGQYSKIQSIRSFVENNTGNHIKMSDKDVLIYADSRNRGTDQWSEQKVVHLPNIAFSYFDFTKLPSYNPDEQTISAKDFYEWYQLDDAEGKDELVLGLTKATEQMIANYTNFSGEVEEGSEENVATDYARTISFYNTLMNDNPSANVFTTTRLFIAGMANSLAANLTKAASDVVNTVNNFANWLDSVDDNLGILKLATTPIKLGAQGYVLSADMLYAAGSALAGIDNPVSEQTRQQIAEIDMLGTIWDTLKDGDVSGFVEIVEKSAGITDRLAETGNSNLLQQAKQTIQEMDKMAYDDLTRLASSATLGSVIGGLAAEVFKQMVVTNPIGQNIGAATLFATGNADTLATGLAVMANLMSAKQLSGAVKAGAFASNIVAQGLSDTVLNDEESLRRMFLDGDPGDAVRAVGLNTLFNGIGEISGLATSEGWSGFKKTQIGQAIEGAEQRGIATVQAKKQKALTRLAEWLNDKKSTRVEGADYMTAFSKAEIEASENIATASKKILAEDASATVAAREAQESAVQGKVDLEVAFTRANTQLGRSVLDLQADPRVAKYWLGVQDAAGAVVKAEGGNGIKQGGKILFSQETADYIALTNRVEYFTAKSGGDFANLPKAEATYAEAIAKRVSDFESNADSGLLVAIKEYVNKLKEYQFNFNNTLVEEGLIDSEWLTGLRETGFWGENGQNYIVTQAFKDNQIAGAEQYVSEWSSGKNWKAKTVADQYSYKPGDVDAHYLDPQLAALSQQTAMAKVKDSREFADALRRTQSLFKEIDTNGKPVSYKELSQIRSEVQNSANRVFKEYRTNDDILNYEFANTYKEIEAIPKRTAKKEKKIAELLDMSDDRINSIALDLDSEQIAALGRDFELPDYQPIRTRAELNELYYGGSDAQRMAIDQCLGIDNLTVANYNKALSETDLAERLTRTYISENNDIIGSARFKEFATEIRTQELTARQQLILKNNYDTIAELQNQAKLVETGADEFTATISRFTDDVARQMKADLADNDFFNSAIKQYTDMGVSKKAATNYLVLDQMKKSLAKNNSDLNLALNKNLNNLQTSGNLTTRQKTRWAKAIKDSIKDDVNSEWAKAVKILEKNGAGSLVDTDAVYKEIYDLMDDFIEGQVKSDTVIQVLDQNGKYHLYEVAPHTAYLYKNRMNFSNVKNNAVVKFFTRTNRMFRLMTTGWSITSFENQWMRDPFNAYIMGGLTRGINANGEQIGRLLGENVVEGVKRELGESGWGNLVEASERAVDAEALADTVARRGELLYGDTAMETEYYRNLMRGRRATLFGDYQDEVGRLEKAIRFLEDKSPGDFRERYLRKGVYSQSFNDALASGKTWKEASKIAEFTADNATTDFSRAFAWGTSITSSVPYLGAAINGSKSFWRLLEIDPVGISGRFVSGLVIPTLALTAQSLKDDINRETYNNIPEYVKAENMVFVVNGEAFKIPIPQELSAFIAPFRQVVEKANGANDNVWYELLLNDLLDVSPVDLTGFANLNDPMGMSADFFSRLSSEAETLVSQLSPTVVKTLYMWTTGRDPYTGQSIDREYIYIDDEGNPQIMDSQDNAIAQWFSGVCRAIYDATGWDFFNISPSVAEKVLGGFMGQAGIDLAGSVMSLFSGDLVGSLGTYGKQIAKPFTATNYDMVNSAWKDFTKVMETEKAKLMAPEGVLWKINNQIKYTSEPAKLQNLKAQYRQAVQEYQDQLFNGVQKFNSIYGSNYDWKKFATVISLLDFGGTAQDLTSVATQNLASEMSYDAREKAKQTMASMGFNGTNDMSIFGYLKTDADGNAEWKATTPTAILDMDNIFYQSKDEAIAVVENTIRNIRGVDGKTLKDKYDEMSEKEDQYYATKNYDALNKLYKEWDIELMASIYPILASNDMLDNYGNSLIENNDLIDLLDNYIRVPSDYMGKGKYISAKTGLNKNRGYAKSYIQYLYKQIGGNK